MRRLRKSAGLLAGTAAMALVLAACADDGDGDGGDTGDNGDGALAGETITIGVFSGWEEGIATSFLWGNVFEDQGATVEYVTAEPGPTFQGVADGSADISFDMWLPNTHADFWEEHQDSLEDLGVWYDDAPLTIAVNEDNPIQSLDEVAENADVVDNRIVSIESGSGLYRITRDAVVPTYGLEDMELLDVGTNAMLQELENAINDGEDILVTLWQPHWAYAAYPIRNLEDPENALAESEQLHAFARPGFSEDFPDVAEWVGDFSLSEEQLLAIEETFVVETEATTDEEYAAAVRSWMEENPDYVAQLTGM